MLRKRIKLDINAMMLPQYKTAAVNEHPSLASTSKNSKNTKKKAKETITKITTLNLDRSSQVKIALPEKQEQPESKMKVANKEPAGKPPSALDLTCGATGDLADNDDDGIVCLSSQSKLIPTVESGENLSVPNISIFDELINQTTSSILPNSKSDYELQDIHIEDSIRVADPLPSCQDISLLLSDDIVNALTEDIPGVAEIERCLAGFSDQTLIEIEHEIGDTVNCINNLPSLSFTVSDKTPLEEDTLADKVLNYEFDDGNDDIDAISVDTSWNGEDDFESDLKYTTEEPKVMQQKSPATPKAASTEFINFCIPKKVIESSMSQGAKEPQQPKASSAQPQLLQHRQMLQHQQQTNQITNSNPRQSIPAAKPAPPVPIFAPPLRLQPHSGAVVNTMPASILNIYASDDNRTTIFGIKCWRYLDGRCQQLNCNHLLHNIGDVQRTLNHLPPDKVRENYGLLLRHGLLFKAYFPLFAETFARRGMLSNLIEMVKDCDLYLAFSVPFLTELYQLLVRCGLTPDVAASHFMNHLWKPHNAATHPALFEHLLRILASANWINYSEQLEHLFKSGFPVPTAFFKSILKDAIDKNQIVLAEKVQQIAGIIIRQSSSSTQHAPSFPPIVMRSDNRFLSHQNQQF
ncbi:GH13221 [Drosophila grimshawi]|uniref:GH13221 n=1 Tax=Drosophila grimshawi TaxID=7222 RepID=B4JQC0_DROGR|nr:GH13221 [Drosophila grimshawi]